jgi:hypothetical protein
MTIQFGERIPGYSIPVLNEREVRASAGLFFLFLFYAIMKVNFEADFTLLKYFIVIFLSDFSIRIFINPKFAPSLILARLLVTRQRPEYVGAPQKKFAWKIGFGLSTIMLLLLVVVNGHSVISAVSCLSCLLFLFLESAFGICIGCLMYGWYYKDKAEYCAGEVCEPGPLQEIQKTSIFQLLIVLGFAIYVAMAVLAFNDAFDVDPGNLWEILGGVGKR